MSNEGPQTSAVNIPPRANSASHRPYDQLTGSLPNGRSSYESGPNMLRDLGNNGGFLKLDKTGLKSELVAAPQSCTSSRSSSLDRSPTGSIGSITGSIASTESRSVGSRHRLDVQYIICDLGPSTQSEAPQT